MGKPVTDYDSPWKEALECYFEAFMAFFFPQAYTDIDWTRGYEFLDKELERVVRDAKLGRRLVDKLVKVWRKEGDEAWVLIHVEVQGQVDQQFTKRMYVYNYRLFDRYDRWVVSLAVLGDEQTNWRPDSYGYELWGCRAGLWFPVAKLLDYETQWAALEQSNNPFAVIVMAHLKTQATERDPQGRLQWKLSLVKRLYEHGLTRKDILELFRFIDWLMILPEDLERSFEDTVSHYEEEMNMPYITSIERIGIEKGLQQGLQQGFLQNTRSNVIDILKARFGTAPETTVQAVNKIDDLSLLRLLLRKAATVASLEEFKPAYA